MKILENLKLDTWYGIVLYIGILFIAASLFFKVEFLEEKHLFGLGHGTFLIGLSYWITQKHCSTIKPPNIYTGSAAFISWREIRHNPITIILLIIGILMTLFFGILIVKGLI